MKDSKNNNIPPLRTVDWEGDEPVPLLEWFDDEGNCVKMKMDNGFVLVFDFEDQDLYIEQKGDIRVAHFTWLREYDKSLYQIYWKMREFYTKDVIFHRQQLHNECDFAKGQCDSEGEFVEQMTGWIEQAHGVRNSDIVRVLKQYWHEAGRNDYLVDQLVAYVKINFFQARFESDTEDEEQNKTATIHQLNAVNRGN